MPDIFTKSFQPPAGLTKEGFILFPTDAAHFQTDYTAVMSCRPQLRLWSQSTWPEDSFTADENKQDLLLHVEDNQNHSAYGYMIYSPDRSICFGSLYVNPISQVLQDYKVTEQERSAISQLDARVDFWTTSEGTSPPAIADFDMILTKELRLWFTNDWKIKPAFCARRGMNHRAVAYRNAELTLLADIVKSEADGSEMNLLLFT